MKSSLVSQIIHFAMSEPGKKMLIISYDKEKVDQALKEAEEIIKKYMPEKYQERFKLKSFEYVNPNKPKEIKVKHLPYIIDEFIPEKKLSDQEIEDFKRRWGTNILKPNITKGWIYPTIIGEHDEN